MPLGSTGGNQQAMSPQWDAEYSLLRIGTPAVLGSRDHRRVLQELCQCRSSIGCPEQHWQSSWGNKGARNPKQFSVPDTFVFCRPLHSPVRRFALFGVVSKRRSLGDHVRSPGSVAPTGTSLKRVSQTDDLIQLAHNCVSKGGKGWQRATCSSNHGKSAIPSHRYQMKDNQMSQSVLTCPKCKGEMILGYVIDFAPGGGSVSQWAKGEPKKVWLPLCWFMPIKLLKLPKTAECLPVGTFRCQSCGFLESYARDEFRPK